VGSSIIASFWVELLVVLLDVGCSSTPTDDGF
jgi:hypothetical protein